MTPETERDIRDWLAIQRAIQQQRDLYKQRHMLEERILGAVLRANIQGSTIQMASGAKLVFREEAQVESLTHKHLLSSLKAAFAASPSPPTSPEALFKFIIGRRPVHKKWAMFQK